MTKKKKQVTIHECVECGRESSITTVNGTHWCHECFGEWGFRKTIDGVEVYTINGEIAHI